MTFCPPESAFEIFEVLKNGLPLSREILALKA